MSLTDITTFSLGPLFLERIDTVDSSKHCYVLESTFRLHRYHTIFLAFLTGPLDWLIQFNVSLFCCSSTRPWDFFMDHSGLLDLDYYFKHR